MQLKQQQDVSIIYQIKKQKMESSLKDHTGQKSSMRQNVRLIVISAVILLISIALFIIINAFSKNCILDAGAWAGIGGMITGIGALLTGVMFNQQQQKKTELTRDEIKGIYNFVSSTKGNIFNKYFIEFCIRNKKQLETEVEIIDSSFVYTEEENNYLQKEAEIINKYATSENGKLVMPITVPNEKIESYTTDISKLKEESKDTFEAIIKKNEDKIKWLKEKIEIELFTVNFDYIPDDINTDIYMLLRENELIED
jgi:uncharacterized integral membrane protein